MLYYTHYNTYTYIGNIASLPNLNVWCCTIIYFAVFFVHSDKYNKYNNIIFVHLSNYYYTYYIIRYIFSYLLLLLEITIFVKYTTIEITIVGISNKKYGSKIFYYLTSEFILSFLPLYW